MITLTNKTVTAKKEHICDFCNLKIESGAQYQYSFNVYSGEGYAWKSHLDCQKLASIFLEDYNDGEGMTQDDFDTCVYESYKEIFGEPCNLKKQSYSEILNNVKNYLLKQ